MPTILRYKGYRFFFYSDEHAPKHIHIEQSERTAKFNLEPIELVRNRGFNGKELRIIRVVIEENINSLKKAWYEYFNY